ncbi:hypothetical protein L249_6747 [Ophiocordyceps polyrhachis-furcata BCC 54312]|uniref:Uncharacterized protein n=1 Tax=Ophiocordyceps polyrhachis-furcata BCC 54312 TaxID=1330021 RepID=A0A367LKF0_9HYPO|nr:hypothetical protein L249_6747 [Ophiocordyceps polyrhachis-furcata BCC 54312]
MSSSSGQSLAPGAPPAMVATQNASDSETVCSSKQPSSPTLTNPDMILPDDDDDFPMTRTQVPFLDPAALYRSMSLGPSTPIIYGNGTMLSDIGEVTEVESVAGSTPPRRFSSRRCSGAGFPMRTSPTMSRMKRRSSGAQDARRLSIESTGTVIESERIGASADFFDDCISIGDSSFHGDDEGSMASSYADDWGRDVDARYSTDRPRYSTTFISRRAEQILANAKRRLTTMEGNLSRARTLGYSPVSDGSTPSPGGDPPSTPDEDAFYTPTTHSRNASESHLPTPSNPVPRSQRSASALGALGGYRRSLSNSMSVDSLDGRHRPTNMLTYHPLDTTLAPSEGNRKPNDVKESSRASSVASPDPSSGTDADVPRSSVATLQVRDIQDQMQGLKNKIASLRDQARADSLRRRSLQGLRTPSPFTHATWDRGSSEPLDNPGPNLLSPSCVSPRGGSVLVSGANGTPVIEQREPDSPSNATSFHEVRESPSDDGDGGIEGAEFVDDAEDIEGVEAVEIVEWKDDNVDHGAEDDGDDVGYEGEGNTCDECSESGDSLYHDSTPHPISHEDREDAFDYERFFLHSAMGTISQQGFSRRGSISSEDSESSVETTRGPTLTVARRASLDTFTTIDSFATAIEGNSTRNSLALDGPADGFVTPSQVHDKQDADRTSSAVGSSSSDGSGHWQNGRVRRATVSDGAVETFHRPSFSSFESTGTNRSFPLVNKVRMRGGVVTPAGSPEHELKQVADGLMNETASVCDKESLDGGGTQSPAMQMLSKADQMMVEQVVASLGRCVLGLTEAGGAGLASADEFRRRIDAARQVLEAGR